MPRRILLGQQRDFVGGLNLRADPFNLAQNESPDMLNVDVDPRGGFALRRAAAPFGDAAGGEVHSILQFKTTGGTEQIIIGVGTTTLKRGTGAAWTSFTATRAGPLRAATFKDRIYIQNGVDAPLRWDGTTEFTMTEGFNNNLSAPTVPPADGKMHKAKCIAVHLGCVFVANTTESSVAHKNRVRWSHPNFPEDYADFHFIDVDTGHDGDEITALVPFGDRLIVFKRHSVFAIYGEPPDRFQVVDISHAHGTFSQESAVLSEYGVYFWSPNTGVCIYDGSNLPESVFTRLQPALQDNDIPPADEAKVHLGWGERRLWAATPFDESTTRNRVFVYDPTLAKGGGWVVYDLKLGPFLGFQPTNLDPLLLSAHVGGTRVLKLEQDTPSDDFGAGAVHIASHYTTRWFDIGTPALDKRWRSPELVVREGEESTIEVRVTKDYDLDRVVRQFFVNTTADADELIWDVGNWDEKVWGGEGHVKLKVHRGQQLGSARAISLKFVGPATNNRWAIDSISLKYILKRLR